MIDPFARMTNSVFARIGEDAVLRSSDACKVSIEKNIAVSGEYGEIAGYRTEADICYVGTTPPKVGDALVIATGPNAGTYKMDALLSDDGYSARWVLL